LFPAEKGWQEITWFIRYSFTLNHDDGLQPEKLHKAEIILTGVSHSGKTPLSVYLAMYGWKVANIPLVNGIDPPKELF